VLYAARCKRRTQKSHQKSPSEHHPTTLSGYVFATKACIDNRKKIVKQQYLLCPRNMVNFGPLAAEIVSLVWGTTSNFNWFRVFGSVTARHSSTGRQPNCGVEQRAPPIFGRATITLGIGPHYGVICASYTSRALQRRLLLILFKCYKFRFTQYHRLPPLIRKVS